MIPQTDRPGADPIDPQIAPQIEPSWQAQLRDAVRSGAELCQLLELRPQQVALSAQAAQQFPVQVPRAFVGLMAKRDPADPLLLQVLNSALEDRHQDGYGPDPLDEAAYNPLPGLLHKYPGRALLIVSGKCAIHCRYCFRRHFPYAANNPGRQNWQPALDYLAADSSLHEVIFSGGDPLSAPDTQLRWLCERLEQIPHLQRLRIHTRLPVVIPQRIDAALLAWLTATRLQIQMVLHINHPNEISPALARALQRLRAIGPCLNQSVLLAGVNDDLDTLANLQERAYAAGVLPYYLFCLDRVQGAAHYAVPRHRALELVRGLRQRLPGYLVPRLAIEEAGQQSKTLLG
ncbi:MAG: EF-P beta-lysylation protein EpmB [Cellvibrionales bacterium]|nr:EF-P beta-lysylation protein EpmB [Cellvibrionales bacterium]